MVDVQAEILGTEQIGRGTKFLWVFFFSAQVKQVRGPRRRRWVVQQTTEPLRRGPQPPRTGLVDTFALIKLVPCEDQCNDLFTLKSFHSLLYDAKPIR